MFLLHKILKHIKIRLKEWNKNEFGNIFVANKVVERKLQDINQTLITNGFSGEKRNKLITINRNGKNYANKRRYSRNRNQECNS